MRTQSLDTSPEFERIQIARIRAFSLAKKFRSVRSWTQSITSANLCALHDAPGDLQNYDLALGFITREYGSTFATLFRHAKGQRSHWTLQTPDLQEALLPFINLCEQFEVCYLLTGSVASSIYGLPRAAQDVEVLADLNPDHLALLLEHLSENYLFDVRALALAVQRQEGFSLLHVSRLVKIDVLLPSTAFDGLMLQHRHAAALIEGRPPLWMASPEDVVLTRLFWYRQSRTQVDDQWNDLLGLLKVQAPTLDLMYLGQQAEALHVSDLLLQALIDAGLRDAEQS